MVGLKNPVLAIIYCLSFSLHWMQVLIVTSHFLLLSSSGLCSPFLLNINMVNWQVKSTFFTSDTTVGTESLCPEMMSLGKPPMEHQRTTVARSLSQGWSQACILLALDKKPVWYFPVIWWEWTFKVVQSCPGSTQVAERIHIPDKPCALVMIGWPILFATCCNLYRIQQTLLFGKSDSFEFTSVSTFQAMSVDVIFEALLVYHCNIRWVWRGRIPLFLNLTYPCHSCEWGSVGEITQNAWL